jgi:acyl-CoA synthetase (AMP-forming)/AMP-acid ligase II
VADVAVVGIPDDLWGELVVAAIVPADGHTLAQEALDALARSQLAGYKVPRRYVELPTLPRNAYGKVVKRELREMLSQDAG